MESGGDDKKRKLNEGDGEAPSLSSEELSQLLGPLTKEQLQELLLNSGVRYPGVANDIRDLASKDPAHRKLFVRGLAWETTSQKLREAFEEYGEIDEGAVVIDKITGKSRGFGFITFKTMDGAYRALKDPSKKIDGRIAVCNLAAVGSQGGPSTTANKDLDQRKLYVGGLDYNTTTEALLSYFGQFGEIEEGSVAYDKFSGKSRGFGFITFKTVDAAKACLATPQKSIDSRNLNVKLAVEGAKPSQGAPQPPSSMVRGPGGVSSYGQPNSPYQQQSMPQPGGYNLVGPQQYQTGLGVGSYNGLGAQQYQQPQANLYGSAQPSYPSQYGQAVIPGLGGLGGLTGGVQGLSSTATTSAGLPGQLSGLTGLGGYYTGGM